MIKKLKIYGITEKILSWIKDFLTKYLQKNVVVSGKKSTPKEILSGVPQGSVLGPILFLIYINDLPSLTETPVKLFADDTKTYSTTNNPDNHEKLQQTTNNFYRWTREWDWDLNIFISRGEKLLLFQRKDRLTRLAAYSRKLYIFGNIRTSEKYEKV